jgi:hypothetical protein
MNCIAVVAPCQRHALLWSEHFEQGAILAIDDESELAIRGQFYVEASVAEERSEPARPHRFTADLATRQARRATAILFRDRVGWRGQRHKR